MPSAGVTATSKDGSSLMNIHPMVVPSPQPYLESNQVTEWTPIMHPISTGNNAVNNSLKSSLTLSNALKSMDCVATTVGSNKLNDHALPPRLESFSCLPSA